MISVLVVLEIVMRLLASVESLRGGFLGFRAAGDMLLTDQYFGESESL